MFYTSMACFTLMTEIPMASDSQPEELQCITCLLPMQYQVKRDGKFIWQSFKCGKQYLVSENNPNNVEEHWSPPR